MKVWVHPEHAGEALAYMMDRYEVGMNVLAKAAGCNHSTIVRIRQGRARPSVPLAERITHALSDLIGKVIQPDDLFPMAELQPRRRLNEHQRNNGRQHVRPGRRDGNGKRHPLLDPTDDPCGSSGDCD